MRPARLRPCARNRASGDSPCPEDRIPFSMIQSFELGMESPATPPIAITGEPRPIPSVFQCAFSLYPRSRWPSSQSSTLPETAAPESDLLGFLYGSTSYLPTLPSPSKDQRLHASGHIRSCCICCFPHRRLRWPPSP